MAQDGPCISLNGVSSTSQGPFVEAKGENKGKGKGEGEKQVLSMTLTMALDPSLFFPELFL